MVSNHRNLAVALLGLFMAPLIEARAMRDRVSLNMRENMRAPTSRDIAKRKHQNSGIYKPHQGKRECARRVRGHHPPSTPRRMWEMETYHGTQKSSKRSVLARTIFGKGERGWKRCPIVLNEIQKY
jgi:hypothetical protein